MKKYNLSEIYIERKDDLSKLKIGIFKTWQNSNNYLKKAKKVFRNAFVTRCEKVDSERKTINVSKQQSVKQDKYVIPACKTEKSNNNKLLSVKKPIWEEEYNIIFESKTYVDNKSDIIESDKNFNNNTDNESDNNTVQSYRFEKYIFVDGHYVNGFKPENCCRKKGHEIIGKLGLRLKLKIADRLGLWGDINVGASHQNYINSYRNKLFFNINSLFLLTRDPFEPLYPGFDLQIGRIPIDEIRGFWYDNSLDSVTVKYQSTLLNGFVLLGTRFNDSRINNSDNKNNIEGYSYLIGSVDYQYYFNHYVNLFYIKEYKDDSDSIGEVKSVWEPAKPDRNINWLGLRLIGNKFHNEIYRLNKLAYWLDLSYMWGENQFVETEVLDNCSAYKRIKGFRTSDVSGFGGELGISYKTKKWGFGSRLGLGQGDDINSNDISIFYQPRISNNKDRLFGPMTVRSYGELSNPDLTNMYLLGIYGGINILRNTWLELNFLRYWQYRKSQQVNFSKYISSPNGKSADLGWEMNLILDGEEITQSAKWRYDVTLAYFKGGEAYKDTDIDEALGIFFKLKRYW